MRVERVESSKTSERNGEVAYCLTPLRADCSGTKEPPALVRNHWHIENRLRHMRGFTYDEDRCPEYVRHMTETSST